MLGFQLKRTGHRLPGFIIRKTGHILPGGFSICTDLVIYFGFLFFHNSQQWKDWHWIHPQQQHQRVPRRQDPERHPPGRPCTPKLKSRPKTCTVVGFTLNSRTITSLASKTTQRWEKFPNRLSKRWWNFMKLQKIQTFLSQKLQNPEKSAKNDPKSAL